MKPDARNYIEVNDFVGLMTNADGGEVPPGASELQTNFMSNRVGEMTGRPGVIECTFEDE